MVFSGLSTTDIYLPPEGSDLSKWAVIACDQHTSQPEYWKRVRAYVGDAPSSLDLIQPEAFLAYTDPQAIDAKMDEYLKDGKLVKTVENGLVITERTTQSGVRTGLVVALDLDCYDFMDGQVLTRATEKTIPERLGTRIKIRENASLELTHIMVFIDDPTMSVIESARGQVSDEDKIYDVELMEGGGHLTGWKIQDYSRIGYIASAIKAIEDKSNGFLYAVGDGNHSLAAAKRCWEEKKKKLTAEEAENDPGRFALVELVNLHSPAIIFRPIHRIVYSGDLSISDDFHWFAVKKGYFPERHGKSIVFTDGTNKVGFDIKGTRGKPPVAIVQEFLDQYLEGHPQAEVDYIHDDDELMRLSNGSNTGILLNAISKDGFFEAIRTSGHLPRKTFSMGDSNEKRYYMESRLIKSLD